MENFEFHLPGIPDNIEIETEEEKNSNIDPNSLGGRLFKISGSDDFEKLSQELSQFLPKNEVDDIMNQLSEEMNSLESNVPNSSESDISKMFSDPSLKNIFDSLSGNSLEEMTKNLISGLGALAKLIEENNNKSNSSCSNNFCNGNCNNCENEDDYSEDYDYEDDYSDEYEDEYEDEYNTEDELTLEDLNDISEKIDSIKKTGGDLNDLLGALFNVSASNFNHNSNITPNNSQNASSQNMSELSSDDELVEGWDPTKISYNGVKNKAKNLKDFITSEKFNSISCRPLDLEEDVFAKVGQKFPVNTLKETVNHKELLEHLDMATFVRASDNFAIFNCTTKINDLYPTPREEVAIVAYLDDNYELNFYVPEFGNPFDTENNRPFSKEEYPHLYEPSDGRENLGGFFLNGIFSRKKMLVYLNKSGNEPDGKNEENKNFILNHSQDIDAIIAEMEFVLKSSKKVYMNISSFGKLLPIYREKNFSNEKLYIGKLISNRSEEADTFLKYCQLDPDLYTEFDMFIKFSYPYSFAAIEEINMFLQSLGDKLVEKLDCYELQCNSPNAIYINVDSFETLLANLIRWQTEDN